MNLERPERAEVRYAEALSLFEQVGDARGVADVLDARAMAAFLHGDVTASIAAFDRVARLFTDAGNLFSGPDAALHPRARARVRRRCR
jgi:hypothetical protein